MMATSPRSGAPQVDWDVAVERANNNQCTYWITVKNLTPQALTFEGRYAIMSWGEETMIRIIIEIDDKQVSFTTTGQAAAPSPPPELLDRAMELGATSAGSAPSEATAAAELGSTAASDAGAAPGVNAGATAHGEGSPRKRISR
jgi:hypothetical protein